MIYYKLCDINLFSEIVLFAMWIGLWGMIDNIINIYIPPDKHDKRIIIFSIIFIFSIVLLYFDYNKGAKIP
jgi:hypothetical protein